MRRTQWIAYVLCLVAGGLCLCQADEQAEMRAILDKAIQASGGEAVLARYKAETFKAKGKFHALGAPVDYTGEWAMQPPAQMRVKIESDINGMNFIFIQAINGDKGWRKFNDAVMELNEEVLAEQKEQLYTEWVQRLTPLKGAAFKLAPLGDSMVGDRPVVGVQVAHKDHRDVNLYFDKEKGLLLKVEARMKDVDDGGKEFTQETIYSDHKDVQGVQMPYKVVIKRDGKEFLDAQTTELKLLEKLDESEFAQP